MSEVHSCVTQELSSQQAAYKEKEAAWFMSDWFTTIVRRKLLMGGRVEKLYWYWNTYRLVYSLVLWRGKKKCDIEYSWNNVIRHTLRLFVPWRWIFPTLNVCLD